MTIKELNEKKLIQGIKNVIKGRPFKGGTRNVTSVPARPELNMGDALIRAKATEIMQDRKGPAGTSPYYYQNPNPKFGTIKEHYKEILNERIFNAANPLGKIETGIRKLINPNREREVAQGRADARVAVSTRDTMAKKAGGIVPSGAEVESRIRNDNWNRRLDAIIAGPRSPSFQRMMNRYDPRPFGGKRDLEESNLLNEIGDTERGQRALRAYIGARSQGIQGIERENRRIDSSIRQVTNRLRGETTHTDEERQRGMQLVNMERKNKRKIGRYTKGIDNALARIRPIQAG